MTAPIQAHPYRKDIDGLRAVAVLSVILYHLNPSWARGGFIGVDLFFVISGYLITGQIRKDLACNSFSIKDFYLRRIRRILPPLLAMLIGSAVTAWLVLKPEDLRSFAYSLVVQPLSLQNLVFLSEGNYFKGAETKALLHTWSLSVEEQFYLFWPLSLLLLKRFSNKTTIAVVCVAIAISFYLSATTTATHPQVAFYLIFTRAWELGVGGLAALLKERMGRKANLSLNQREVLAWLSVGAFGYCIFIINSALPFPGKIALVPVMVAFIIVLIEDTPQTVVSKFLASPVLVWIGLISYPLYLWHWPLLVFMSHLNIKPTETLPFIGFWVATLSLAYASFRWLETPIRSKAWLASSRSLLMSVAASFVVLMAFGIHVVVTDGASYRFDDKARAFLTARIQSYTKRCEIAAMIADLRSPICKHREEVADKRRILLWGNSHASMLIPMLQMLAVQYKTSLYVNTKNNRPVMELEPSNKDAYVQIMTKVKEKAITDVILASSWQGLDNPLLENQLKNTVSDLTQQNITVWLVVNAPGGEALDPITAYMKNKKNPQFGSVSWMTYNNASRLVELTVFQRLAKNFPTVQVIDASSNFCDETQCWGGRGNEVWYRDATHLSNAGALAIVNFFLPAFQH